MKRRLNILCVVVMLVLCYSVVESAYYMGMGISLGAKTGIEAAQETKNDDKLKQHNAYNELTNMKYIALMPRSLNCKVKDLLCDSIYNTKTGTYVPAAYSTLAVSVQTEESVGSKILSGLLGFVHLVSIVGAVVFFIKIIVAINRSNIFNWRNVRRLRLLGILLIVGFGCSWLAEYLSLCNLREVLSLQNYDLTLTDIVDVTNLVLGLTALIIAEVFAIGLKMKEEQELTI